MLKIHGAAAARGARRPHAEHRNPGQRRRSAPSASARARQRCAAGRLSHRLRAVGAAHAGVSRRTDGGARPQSRHRQSCARRMGALRGDGRRRIVRADRSRRRVRRGRCSERAARRVRTSPRRSPQDAKAGTLHNMLSAGACSTPRNFPRSRSEAWPIADARGKFDGAPWRSSVAGHESRSRCRSRSMRRRARLTASGER